MLNPYDLKAVQQVALWGLPMYRLPGGAPAAAATAADAITVDPLSGLRSATVNVHPNLQPVSTPDGRLYVTNGGADQAVHPYPILPSAVLDVPAGAGLVAHGAVPLSWTIATLAITSANAPNGYAFANATVDNAAAEPAPPSRTIFPTAFSTIGTTFGLDDSARQSLVVTPAQFRSAPTGNPAFGQLREYTDGNWLVTYAPASVTDFTGPQFGTISATEVGAHTVLVADVSDAAGVARVFVQVLRGGVYSRIELTPEPNTPGRWAGTVAGTDVSPVQEATYFALDRNGNSSTANNKGPGYIPLPADDGGASALIFSPTTPSASGWYLVQPTVTVAGAGRLQGAGRRERHAGGVRHGHGRRAHRVRHRSRRAHRELGAGAGRHRRPGAGHRAERGRRRSRPERRARRLPAAHGDRQRRPGTGRDVLARLRNHVPDRPDDGLVHRDGSRRPDVRPGDVHGHRRRHAAGRHAERHRDPRCERVVHRSRQRLLHGE
jgi:hypothetical protein